MQHITNSLLVNIKTIPVNVYFVGLYRPRVIYFCIFGCTVRYVSVLRGDDSPDFEVGWELVGFLGAEVTVYMFSQFLCELIDHFNLI